MGLTERSERIAEINNLRSRLTRAEGERDEAARLNEAHAGQLNGLTKRMKRSVAAMNAADAKTQALHARLLRARGFLEVWVNNHPGPLADRTEAYLADLAEADPQDSEKKPLDRGGDVG